MRATLLQLPRRLGVLALVALLAGLLRLIAGTGFANYDTLYGLVWGQQLSRGETPQYGLAIAPTPHPLVEALGFVLSPLGPRAVEDIIVALAFGALAGVGWVLFRLGQRWFGWLAGAVAALLFLTRVPVLSDGVRAYIDIPYLLFVLWALLLESRRPRAGAPVLVLLGLAGLLRPEAWAFSGLYWLWLAWPQLRAARARAQPAAGAHAALAGERSWRELAWLALLAAAAPALWLVSDALVTGNALWSLTNTRHTASTLDRVRGIRNVPQYVPRRIGEILRPDGLVAAAVGGVLALWLLRRRALIGAVAGVLAVLVLALFAALGLPLNTRYAFGAAAILSLFAGAAVSGWMLLDRRDPHRRWWLAASAIVVVLFAVFTPSQYRRADTELDNLARQGQIQDDLVALVRSGAISLRCGQVGVPNHRPVPLLALRLQTRPSNVVDAQVRTLARGSFVQPANAEVERDYTLDRHDPHPLVARVPPGFTLSARDPSWDVYERCI